MTSNSTVTAEPRAWPRVEPAPWVVKIGGSLAESPDLPPWLEVIARASRPIVVVTGGGPFADEVRALQRRWSFPDATAHRMAIMAMEQYAHMLAGLSARLAPASSAEDIAARLREGLVPVWLPVAMTADHPDIPESWSVTSDSLAVWLAGEIGADRVILVKSAPPPPGPVDAAELAARGLVDDAFARFHARVGCAAWCVGPADHHDVAHALSCDGDTGYLIRLQP